MTKLGLGSCGSVKQGGREQSGRRKPNGRRESAERVERERMESLTERRERTERTEARLIVAATVGTCTCGVGAAIIGATLLLKKA